jgi:hypothetical protein
MIQHSTNQDRRLAEDYRVRRSFGDEVTLPDGREIVNQHRRTPDSHNAAHMWNKSVE